MGEEEQHATLASGIARGWRAHHQEMSGEGDIVADFAVSLCSLHDGGVSGEEEVSGNASDVLMSEHRLLAVVSLSCELVSECESVKLSSTAAVSEGGGDEWARVGEGQKMDWQAANSYPLSRRLHTRNRPLRCVHRVRDVQVEHE